MSFEHIKSDWLQPPNEFSIAPFWFWNDDLDETEITRQLDEFQSHAIDAFVLHPRLGLPEHLGWMSDGLLDKMRFAIEQAKQRGMWVILYDEGMYPSGSSAGQVVAENPEYQCRGMVRINLDIVQPNTVEQGVRINADGEIELDRNQTLLTQVIYEGQRYAIVDRPIDSVIRGLHYIDENITDASGESPENAPLATDLLNPDAVACFIRLVYDRFYEEFGTYFGSVIIAIFTDEPALLGRPREKNLMPSTKDILAQINDFLGYDFAPYLPKVWDCDESDAVFRDFERSIEHRFEEIYYTQLYEWCEQHQIALTGHPAEPDATRHLRFFHIPGQDIVWRYIEPDKPSALEGRQSTQGKAASSMMLHTNRRRNANEFCGAYGHNFTFEEMQYLANWLLVRGCNLLIPHAFYYSIRGPRKDERPPDVGLHSAWWGDSFTAFTQGCRRLSWLNTDSQHVCHIAILGEHHNLPWDSAKACFQNQIDFNYLDIDDLGRCEIGEDKTLRIVNQAYHVLVVSRDAPPNFHDKLKPIEGQIEIVYWDNDAGALINRLQAVLPPSPFANIEADSLRIRHIQKADIDWYIVFNETKTPLTAQLELTGTTYLLNPSSEEVIDFSGDLELHGHQLLVIVQIKE
jgi:hypothetical protein